MTSLFTTRGWSLGCLDEAALEKYPNKSKLAA